MPNYVYIVSIILVIETNLTRAWCLVHVNHGMWMYTQISFITVATNLQTPDVHRETTRPDHTIILGCPGRDTLVDQQILESHEQQRSDPVNHCMLACTIMVCSNLKPKQTACTNGLCHTMNLCLK